MAFQADAFQNDAFQVLEEAYSRLQDLTPPESQHLANVASRLEWGEADEDDVVDAVPEWAKPLVEQLLSRREVFVRAILAGVPLFLLGQGIDYILRLQAEKHERELEDDHRQFIEQVERMLEELRRKHPQPPGHRPKQP